jgi:hypothetical protein
LTHSTRTIGKLSLGVARDITNIRRLYGTGATIYGGHDLLKWDTAHNVTIKSLATGIEETAVLGLISPPGGPPLLSAVGDIGGFYHSNLDTAPKQAFHTPTYGTTNDLDYAGNKPSNIVRTGSSDTEIKIALSYDYGVTWSPYYGGSTSTAAGKVAISADADTILLMSSGTGALVSRYTTTFSAVSTLPSGAAIASDKRNNSMFYGGSAGRCDSSPREFQCRSLNHLAFTFLRILVSRSQKQRHLDLRQLSIKFAFIPLSQAMSGQVQMLAFSILSILGKHSSRFPVESQLETASVCPSSSLLTVLTSCSPRCWRNYFELSSNLRFLHRRWCIISLQD